VQEINLSVQLQNGIIEANFDSIKAALSAELETYKGMVFTEESKKDAKDTVAYLRKFRKALDDKRKEIKNAYMAPCDAFEAQVNELKKQVDEPINFINQQIAEFERKRIEEKQALIKNIYEDAAAEHTEAATYLPLQKIYDSRWENATTTKKAITEAITDRMVSVEKDLATIRGMESEFEDKGIEKYKMTLALSDAIATMNQYQKQKEETMRREQERAARLKEEEAHKASEPMPEEVKPESTKPIQGRVTIIEPKAKVENEMTDYITYQIVADPFQLAQLEAYMRQHDIKFRRA
jgi:hypothetical protein